MQNILYSIKKLLGEIPRINEFIHKFKFSLQVEQHLYKCKSHQQTSFELWKNAFGKNVFLFEWIELFFLDNYHLLSVDVSVFTLNPIIF